MARCSKVNNMNSLGKSYVSLERNICPICGFEFDTGSIIMDKRLKNTLDHSMMTGYSYCPECNEQIGKGFTALVEEDEELREGNRPYRTGRIMFLKKEDVSKVFVYDTIPEVAYITKEVYDYLVALSTNAV